MVIRVVPVFLSCFPVLLLIGTPLQNSLEELRALLEFLMPSLFMDPNNPEAEEINKDDEMHWKQLGDEVGRFAIFIL